MEAVHSTASYGGRQGYAPIPQQEVGSEQPDLEEEAQWHSQGRVAPSRQGAWWAGVSATALMAFLLVCGVSLQWLSEGQGRLRSHLDAPLELDGKGSPTAHNDDDKGLTKKEEKLEEKIEAIATADERTCMAPRAWTFGWDAWTFEESHTLESINPQKKNMTLQQARSRCSNVTGCKGFTFQGATAPKGPVKVDFLKGWNRGEPQSECDALCRKTPAEYQKLDLCKDESLSKWRAFAKMGLRGKCTVNVKTGSLDCTDKFYCKGGRSVVKHAVDVSRSATYDCTKCNRQNEGLRVECCRLCQEETCKHTKQGNFSIKGHLVDKVICKGCEKRDMKKIAAEETDFCKLYPGHFSCKYHATCHTGHPTVNVTDQTYSCSCNNCGNCGDPNSRAQCCVDCLSRTCALKDGSSIARQVCAGCWPLPSSTTTAPPTETSLPLEPLAEAEEALQ